MSIQPFLTPVHSPPTVRLSQIGMWLQQHYPDKQPTRASHQGGGLPAQSLAVPSGAVGAPRLAPSVGPSYGGPTGGLKGARPRTGSKRDPSELPPRVKVVCGQLRGALAAQLSAVSASVGQSFSLVCCCCCGCTLRTLISHSLDLLCSPLLCTLLPAPGVFDVERTTVELSDGETVSAVEFEKRGGRESTRNWRRSIYVAVAPDGKSHPIGHWLSRAKKPSEGDAVAPETSDSPAGAAAGPSRGGSEPPDSRGADSAAVVKAAAGKGDDGAETSAAAGSGSRAAASGAIPGAASAPTAGGKPPLVPQASGGPQTQPPAAAASFASVPVAAASVAPGPRKGASVVTGGQLVKTKGPRMPRDGGAERRRSDESAGPPEGSLLGRSGDIWVAPLGQWRRCALQQYDRASHDYLVAADGAAEPLARVRVPTASLRVHNPGGRQPLSPDSASVPPEALPDALLCAAVDSIASVAEHLVATSSPAPGQPHPHPAWWALRERLALASTVREAAACLGWVAKRRELGSRTPPVWRHGSLGAFLHDCDLCAEPCAIVLLVQRLRTAISQPAAVEQQGGTSGDSKAEAGAGQAGGRDAAARHPQLQPEQSQPATRASVVMSDPKSGGQHEVGGGGYGGDMVWGRQQPRAGGEGAGGATAGSSGREEAAVAAGDCGKSPLWGSGMNKDGGDGQGRKGGDGAEGDGGGRKRQQPQCPEPDSPSQPPELGSPGGGPGGGPAAWGAKRRRGDRGAAAGAAEEVPPREALLLAAYAVLSAEQRLLSAAHIAQRAVEQGHLPRTGGEAGAPQQLALFVAGALNTEARTPGSRFMRQAVVAGPDGREAQAFAYGLAEWQRAAAAAAAADWAVLAQAQAQAQAAHVQAAHVQATVGAAMSAAAAGQGVLLQRPQAIPATRGDLAAALFAAATNPTLFHLQQQHHQHQLAAAAVAMSGAGFHFSGIGVSPFAALHQHAFTAPPVAEAAAAGGAVAGLQPPPGPPGHLPQHNRG